MASNSSALMSLKQTINTYHVTSKMMNVYNRQLPLIFFLLLISTSVASDAKLVANSALGVTVKPVIMVIVDSSIYDSIKISLDQYVADVETTGFLVNVTQTSQLPNNTARGLRAYLQQLWNQELVGAVLVGDVAEAWFEVDGHSFPTDAYYMDLDGTWFDSDSDGMYDGRGGNLSPEIWIGRLKASPISQYEPSMFNNYFRKNHLYRTGSVAVPWWRSLVYIDDQGAPNKQEAENSLGYVTTDRTCVAYPTITNATAYKSLLENAEGYHWLYLMSHGNATNHSFYAWQKQNTTLELEGTVYSSDYTEIDPRIFFYQFFTCAGARYTSQDYLAGSAVFTTSWGLAAVGSTDDIYSFSFEDFFRYLSEGKNLGDAFKQWLSNSMERNIGQYVTESRWQILFNAMTLIGDPTLKPIVETHDVAITNLEVSVKNLTGLETLFIAATVENHGRFPEKVRVEMFYDSKRILEVYLVLGIGESSNITFSPPDSSQFIRGKHSSHRVEAKASITVGEFHKDDNLQVAYFEGKTIENPSPLQFPPIILPILVNIGSAFAALFIFKQIMSDRPLLLICLARVRKFLRKL